MDYRRSNRHLYRTGLNAKWTPVPQVKKQFKVGHYKSTEVMRTQFPLRAASAKTVHRCQGDTMSAAVIDLDGRGFVHSHYVALSRVKSLNNLHLINLNEQSIKISTQVENEMKRLKTEIQLNSSLQFLDTTEKDNFTILFHNIRSLVKNINNIKKDPNFHTADILIYGETKLCKKTIETDITVQNYRLKRFDWKKSNATAYGLAMYLHDNVTYSNVHSVQSLNNAGTAMEAVVLIVDGMNIMPSIQVIGLYVSPKTGIKEIHDFISSIELQSDIPVVIVGDFNINLKDDSSKCKFDLPGHNLKQLIDRETTEYYSLIDHIYTDLPGEISTCGVFETYFSDHKPVWMKVKKK